MATIALSEGQRLLLDGLAMGKVLDHVPAPVLILHEDGTAWLNASARELDDWLKVGDPSRSLMLEIGPALQPALTALNTDDSPQALRAPFRQQSGAERAYRAILIDASSASRPEACSAVILAATAHSESGELQADVLTELARARLEEAQRQLLQADRLSTIGQLAAGVAHEINNPIGYVQSNLETLRDYVSSLFRLISTQDTALRQLGVSHAGQMQQIEKVRQEIDFDFLAKDLPTLLTESQEGISRVRKIIQDLREFSRAGHAETWTLADIHAGIDSTINIVWNDLKYKVELVKQFGDLPPIECLPSQINQVFMNILVNAGHAIDRHGQITIATRAVGDFAHIEISDNGKGIAQEHLPRIFEPFFTTKPVGKGTGLGLSISYGIVRKHNGEIDVRSELGIGTTFVIKLPVRQQQAAGSAPNGSGDRYNPDQQAQ
ncbi:MAG TPA: ATP-binding protein [Rudaea sp.]|jgi:signal transduction histidine kinase